jgi:hypothetical protein
MTEQTVRSQIVHPESWWGSDVLQIDDPDGNALFFPVSA